MRSSGWGQQLRWIDVHGDAFGEACNNVTPLRLICRGGALLFVYDPVNITQTLPYGDEKPPGVMLKEK